MSKEDKLIRLSCEEERYLKESEFLPKSLREIVRSAGAFRHDVYFLRIARDNAETFRSLFTDRLARVGFDSNYEVTDEGRLLEDLIDRFFVDVRPDSPDAGQLQMPD